MRKSDVQRSYHQGHSGDPMVNVKVHNFPYTDVVRNELYTKVARDNGDGTDVDLFAAFAREHFDKSGEDWTWGAALELAWELLEADAKEIFGDAVKVYSAGRSGGWAVVEGLADVDDWDAIDLGRWAKFCKYARDYTDDIPYQQVALLYINDWEQRREQVESLAAEHGPITVG